MGKVRIYYIEVWKINHILAHHNMLFPYNNTEQSLIAQFSIGNEQAFNELYFKYAPTLLREAAQVLHSKEDAEDVVQELFVNLWNRRETIEINSSLAGYLHMSVRYLAIHFMERNMRKGNFLESFTTYSELFQYVSPDRELEIKELRERIDYLAQKLPAKMREVFLLSRNEQLSYKEIAKRLAISEETVKKQVYNALKIIRQQMKDHPAMGILIAILFI